ncbi:peptidoglycan DD-metalloendopeptidase family protein [Listeria grandensis]|uniref:Peptidoglycan DD-metalloendopeptidase family protein n=1 Tax=Listeria grandensis TaxID=1494963 RepID=A0A7X0Y197_9LIST|nr:M23 family metallopeptidase [Listeria grandensis]MBC1935176.1 peptidoglycan DD-metalloendopeptidase family protein [Listeria grandensis]
MAGALRKTTIEIDWKINNKMLQEANNETDSMIKRAGEAEKSYTKTNKAIDGTTSAIKTQNSAVGKATGEVVQFQGKAKHAFDTTTKGAKEAQSNVVHMENAFDKSKKSAVNMGKDTKNALNNAKESTNGLKNKFGELDQGVSNMASKAVRGLNLVKTAVFAIGTGAVVSAGKKVFELASDTNESLNKVEVAFGKNADSVKKWSKTTLDNIGLARGTALDLAATYGDMSTSMGLSTQEADKMSTSMVDLAGDLASFKNIGIDRANTALNGVFTGETEALKSLGIVMTQTNLEQFAMSSGALKTGKDQLAASKNALAREKAQKQLNTAIKEHGKNSLEAREAQLKLTEVEKKSNTQTQASLKSLSQAELVRLRYNYVMNATKNSHHDFANTSDQAANASRVFSESLKELGSNAGQYLLPIFTPAIIKASNFIKKMSDIPGTMKKLSEEAGPTIEGAKDLLGSIGETLKEDVIPTAKDFALAIGPAALDAGAASLKAIGWTFKTFISPPLREIREFVEKHPEGMKNTAKFAGIGLTAFLGFKVVTGIFTKTQTSVERLINAIKRIGPATTAASVQSSAAVEAMDTTVNAKKTQTAVTPSVSGGGKLAKTGGLFSKATKGIRGMGAVGKLAGGVGVIGVGLSAIDLLGMNKSNAGNKVGSFGGSVGGMAGGAAIGTLIAPGVGTAIGGAIGAFAGSALGKKLGSYLQKEGPEILKKFKAGWKGLSAFAAEHPIIGAPVNYINKHIETYKKGAKQIKKIWDEASAALIPDKTNVSGKGVSKNTAKQVNSYVDADNKMASEFQYKMYSGEKTSAKENATVNKSYDSQASKIVSAYDKKEQKSAKNIDFFQQSGVMSNSDAKSAKNRTKEFYNIGKADAKKNASELKRINNQMYKEQESATQMYEKRINAIKAKAKKEGRVLTSKENAEITRLENTSNAHRKSIYTRYEGQISAIQKKQQREAVTSMSRSAKEQKLILGKLQDDSGKISAKQAADVVKNSKKAKDGAVKEANSKYTSVIKKAEEEYYVNGSISKQQYEKIVGNAKKTRDEAVQKATDMHNGVVDQAKKQAAGHASQVDWEKGQVLGIWDNIKIGLSKAVNWVTSGVNSVLKFFKIKEIPPWNPSGSGGGGSSSGSGSSSRLSGGGKQSGSLAMNYTGSNSASGQIMAGEEGIEIAYDKANAKARILGANGPEITYVNPGTKILNHTDSKKVLSGGLGAGKVLPGFAKGNSKIGDFVSASVEKVQAAGGAIRDGASTMWDWMSDPVSKVKALITKNNPFGGDGVQALGSGIFKHFGTGVMDYVKNKIGDYMSAGLGPSSGGTFGPRFGSPFRFTSGYGPRVVFGKSEFHKGVDYGAPTGTPLPAQYSGVVSHAGSGGGFGNLVKIKVAQGVETLYGHLSKILTSNGAIVRAGQTIGLVGSTGRSTGPHVHYQVNAGGSPVNPGSSIGGKKEPSSATSGDTAKIAEKKGLAFKNGGRPPVNKSVLVGEEGPELFETDSPGTIHTASQTRDLLSNRKGNGEVHYHFDPQISITVQGSNTDATGIASEVKGALYEMFQQWIEQIEPGEVY